jgi:hypothetical protein
VRTLRALLQEMYKASTSSRSAVTNRADARWLIELVDR